MLAGQGLRNLEKRRVVDPHMMDADYFREQAERGRRLAQGIVNRPDIARQLHDMAWDYDEIADHLEAGADEVRHPELMPQERRD